MFDYVFSLYFDSAVFMSGCDSSFDCMCVIPFHFKYTFLYTCETLVGIPNFVGT